VNASPSDVTDRFPAEMRTRWRAIVVREVMSCAVLFNLVDEGATDLAQLPADAHAMVVRLVDELVRKACTEEKRAGKLPGTQRRVIACVHNGMKPFARRGQFYVEHLIGQSAVQREFDLRIEGIEPITWDI